MLRSPYLTLLPFVGLALVIIFLPIPVLAAPQTHHITLTASQFAFDPPVLRVNQGDRVVITLQAADVTHGFYLDGYGLETRFEPGISRQIEFVADRSGKFRYRCAVSCGSLHPFMIGELVVGPNLVFGRVVGLVLVALAGTLVCLRYFPLQVR